MFSKLGLPVQKYIDTINSERSMPAVHHYTSVEGALGILDTGRMWFTERAHLNDPSEISYGIEIARDVLSGRGRRRDATLLGDRAQRVFRDFRFFSASFSFACDELSQWRRYAESGRGVALSFKASAFAAPKAFVDTLIPDNPTAFVCPMSYNSILLRSVIVSMIELWTGDNIDELANYLFMISGMFKADRWRSEEEYRFFVHHPYARISGSEYHKTRERDDRTVSYLDLPIQGWNSPDGSAIHRICCGPAASSGLERELADFMRARNLWPQGGIWRSGIQARCFPHV